MPQGSGLLGARIELAVGALAIDVHQGCAVHVLLQVIAGLRHLSNDI